MFKTRHLALVLGLASPFCAADSLLGVHAGAQLWQSAFGGDAGESALTIDNNLGLDDASNTAYWLALEHGVPLLPNVKVAQLNLHVNGNGRVNAGDIIDNIVFSQDQDVVTNFDVDNTDVTFYYELLDNWLTLDLGLTVRNLDGQLTAAGTLESETVDVDEWLPMLYGNVRFDLPFTGMYANIESNGIGYNGDSYTDISAAVGYETSLLFVTDVGLEVGYRQMSLKLDSSDLKTDMSIDGFYAGLRIHF